MTSKKIVRIVSDEYAVIEDLCKLIEKSAKDAIKRDDVFKVGLSGGSLATFLAKGLQKINTDWSKWKLFFCDERIVPLDNSDSNFGVYKTALIGVVPLAEDQFVKINPQLPAEEAARDYIQKMAVHFPPDELPRFHLLLLGMGPDGHTCSLFPGHRLLDEASVWVAPITDSPKPPPSRITLTFPVLNNAECCAFAVSGQSKAEMVKGFHKVGLSGQSVIQPRLGADERILKDEENLPAARVLPTQGSVTWLLDEAAGSLLGDAKCLL